MGPPDRDGVESHSVYSLLTFLSLQLGSWKERKQLCRKVVGHSGWVSDWRINNLLLAGLCIYSGNKISNLEVFF